MGYQTTYRLSVEPEQESEFFQKLELGGRDPEEELELDPLFGDSCKWYEHEKEMLAVSKKYPDLLFVLDGDGEEAGDIWRKFFKGGLLYEWRPNIERPEFDPRLLRRGLLK